MTEEHKRKIGLANSVLMKEKWKDGNYRKHMSEIHKGKCGYWNGKNRGSEFMAYIRKFSKGNLQHGKSNTPEYRVYYQNQRRIRKYQADGSHIVQEWQKLKEKFNFACANCGKKEPDIKLTEDHIIPLTKGGSDFIDNIQPLCRSCNSKKSNRL
jgi:5-methylcytosine-specific restriction endonuclease McrA